MPYSVNVLIASSFLFASTAGFFGGFLRFNLELSVSKVVGTYGRSRVTFSWISSSFFASKSSFGTPCGFACALRHKVHSSLQKPAVSFSRKPVSWIWRVLMSGCAKLLVGCRTVVHYEEVHTKREFSRRLKQSSITTSSSEPRISEILPAIHLRTELLLSATQIGEWMWTDFFMTSTLTFSMSTFWLNSGGNFVRFRSFWSTVWAMLTVAETKLRDVRHLAQWSRVAVPSYNIDGWEIFA